MTTVRDFSAPDRAGTALQPVRTNTAQPIASPLSPVNSDPMHHAHHTRRGSRTSTFSTSTREGGMRHRTSRHRTNTLKSYHEPEHPDWQPGAEPGIDTAAEEDGLPPHLSSQLSTLKAECDINIIDISPSDAPRHLKANNETLAQVLEEPRPADYPCRWISVNGLSWDVIKCLGNKYHLHRLAIEDMIHTHTRTKVDWYADHAFVVLTLQKLVLLHKHRGKNERCDCKSQEDAEELDEKMEEAAQWAQHRKMFGRSKSMQKEDLAKSVLPRYLDRNRDGKIDEFVQAHSGTSESSPIKPIRTLHRYESAQIPEHTAFMEKHSALSEEELAVSVEQVAIFLLADNTVISFFEHSAEDVETPIIQRLSSPQTMLRISCDASMMLQAIIDAIVDLVVPVKNAYNKCRKELQVDAMTNPDIKTSRALHIFGEEIDMLQNLFKPIVHLVNALRDHNADPMSNNAHSFTVPAPPAYPSSLPQGEEVQNPSAHHHITNTSQQQPPPANGNGPPKTKRDREGAPTYARSLSAGPTTRNPQKRQPLIRTETFTGVSITPLAHTYFGDVLDHCITMIQAFEQMDASASNISTLIFNTVGAKTNNFMMILAVVTVFFAPLTFISGYFGMNFTNGDGLDHYFSFFWVVAIPSLVGFMLIVFATMLWDNVEDFFAKRGIRAHRRRRRLNF